MRVVIFNEELRTVMQMYLALSNHFDVDIAEDEDDLMQMLAQNSADLTLLDLSDGENSQCDGHGWQVAGRIYKEHPEIKIIGICDKTDEGLNSKAARHGIKEIVTRPIKNRELLKVIG